MTDRILDMASEPAHLSVRDGLLVVRQHDKGETTIPFEEVAVLVVSHRQVAYTHSVFAELAKHGGVFVACDERHIPVGLLSPLEGHHLQAERFARQADASTPLKKRLWQQVVRAKVSAQGNLLQALHQNDHGLIAMASRVKSGDSDNIEGQAARRYWPVLFGDASFKRDHEREDQNKLLNYGYSVLRAMTARAVCASGLHPTLGLHHHNRYDAYCLADDLMEPYRPVVDAIVAVLVLQRGSDIQLDREIKRELLNALGGRVKMGNEERTIFDALGKTCASLAKAYEGKTQKLLLPQV